MGFLSFITTDTGKSMPNVHSSRPPVAAYMIDDKGNAWDAYKHDGYGDFGGMDFFVLTAIMNGRGPKRPLDMVPCFERYREIGARMYYHDGKRKYVFPNFVEDPSRRWEDVRPEECPDQGYFYPRGEDAPQDQF